MSPDMFPDLTWCEDCDKPISRCECERCPECGHTARYCHHRPPPVPESVDD